MIFIPTSVLPIPLAIVVLVAFANLFSGRRGGLFPGASARSGMRRWAVVTKLLLNLILWGIAPGELFAFGWPSTLVSFSPAIACIGLCL